MKHNLHSKLDIIIISLNTNFKNFLQHVRIPVSNHTTYAHKNSQLINSLQMELQTEKIVKNCNDLLALIKEVKMMLLLYDYDDIAPNAKSL